MKKYIYLGFVAICVVVLPMICYFLLDDQLSLKKVALVETKPRAGTKYLQWSCRGLCGGLGDRFKGLFSSYAIALLTKRSFLIEMPWPCPPERIFEPNEIDWVRRPNDTYSRLNETNRVISTFLDPYNQLKSEDLIEFAEKASDLLTIHSNQMFMNAFASNPYLKYRIRDELGYTPDKFKFQYLFHSWFKKMFKLNKKLEAEFQEMRRIVKKDKPGHKLICAQYRQGMQTQTNLGETRFVSPGSSKHYWRFMNETFLTKAKLNGSDYTIYVTTDNNQAKEEARQFFGHEKVFITSGKSNFHIDRDFPRKMNETEQTQVCGDVSKIVLDFLLLGECDMAVITHSSFGVLGAWNRPEPGKDLYVYSTLNYVRKGMFAEHNLTFVSLEDLSEFHFAYTDFGFG